MRRRLALLTLAPPALAVLYLGSKHFTHPPAAPLNEYDNRLEKRTHRRSDFRSAEQCRPCHTAIYDDWNRSYLSKSYTRAENEIELHRITLSLRGIETQEVRFCLECHAPLALTSPEDLDILDPLSQEGVTCTVCHSVVETHADPAPANFVMDPLAGMGGPFDDARSPFHKTEQREFMKRDDSTLCGACHTSQWPRTGLSIDWTYKEWDEATAPRADDDKTCQDCHMPEVQGYAASLDGVEERTLRRHTFPGGHDPEYVRTAAELEVTASPRGQQTAVDVLVRNLGGHNLPTGNPPAPELRLYVLDGDDVVGFRSYRNSWYMGNGMHTLDVTIADRPGPDTTLLPYEERQEEFLVDPSDALKVRLEFSYWRPFEPSQRLGSYSSTIFNHLTHPDESLLNVARTLSQGRTWRALADAIGSSKGDPIVIQEVSVR